MKWDQLFLGQVFIAIFRSTLSRCRKAAERPARKSHPPHLIGLTPESAAHIQDMEERGRQQELRRFYGAASLSDSQ